MTNRKKEEDMMTRIGQMIFNDGYAKGCAPIRAVIDVIISVTILRELR